MSVRRARHVACRIGECSGLVFYLVRHGKTRRRARSAGAGSGRTGTAIACGPAPLSAEGWEQARFVERHLSHEPLARIVCASERRSVETMEPTRVARGLPVEVVAADLHGETLRAWARRELGHPELEAPTAVCGPVEWLEEILESLLPRGAHEGPGVGRKGSVVRVQHQRGRNAKLDLAEPPCAAQGPIRAAVLDLGSTSFTLLVADVSADGALRPVARERVSLRLGRWALPETALPEPVCNEACDVVRRLAARASRAGAETLLPIGTAVFRDASNGSTLAARVGEVLGQPVALLSGEREAEAAFCAFREIWDLGDRPTLGVDMGGGSLDVALGTALELRWSATLPLGAVRMRRLHGGDLRRREARRALRREVAAELDAIRRELERERPTRCLVAGGAPRALARLTGGQRSRESATPLGREQLRCLRERLLGPRAKRRARGIDAHRLDALPTASVVLEELLGALGLEQLEVSGWGVREGLLLQYVRGLYPPGSAREPGAQLPCSASSLAWGTSRT